MRNLVIVESPTKARTISKFLGSDYDIKFSMGHVMDLPKSKLGVDVQNDFATQYEIVEDKKSMIAELRSAAKSAGKVMLATDPDREGEAISADIKKLLIDGGKGKGISADKFVRVVFHEITEGAIKEAVANPRDIDTNLVDAQTARRILDRLVGYQLSPVLWKKVRRGLSAGRVQSVALRLIVEREREIEKFVKEKYWTIHAMLCKATQDLKLKTKNEIVEFTLIEINGEKIELQQKFDLYDGEYKLSKTQIDSKTKADQISEDLKQKQLIVSDVVEREMRRSPYAPFTTSTLQQDSARRFGFAAKRTMNLAQKLYEEGHITYHRTDSVTLATTAITQIRNYIQHEFGNKFLPVKPRMYMTKQKSAQEAHEGIRPTKFTTSGMMIEQNLGRDHGRLYDLIWKRTVASQMADAIIESTTVYADTSTSNPGVPLSGTIGSHEKDSIASPGTGRYLASFQNDKKDNPYRLKANGSVLLFEGFLKLTPQALQDTRLPQFTAEEVLITDSVLPTEHETLPPPRYNDASIIQTLEEKGIGRPSTYASIISTISDRGYVERVNKRYQATAIGTAVNDFLVTNFSNIDDIPFTALMEDELDQIANGQKEWKVMMREFYTPFEEKLKAVEGAERVKIAVEEVDEKCPVCNANLVIRHGRFGKFLSCSKFPECKFTKALTKDTNLICPKDNGKIVERKTRKGRTFYGCANYPSCDFAAWKLQDIKNWKEGDMASFAKKTARPANNTKVATKRNMVKRVIRRKKTISAKQS